MTEKEFQTIKREVEDNSPKIRREHYKTLRDSRENLLRELDNLETLQRSTLFFETEEEDILRDTISGLRESIVTLDSLLSAMEDTFPKEEDSR